MPTTNKKTPQRSKVYKSVLSIAKKLKMSPDAYKKQFRKSTTADWIAERKKLRAAQVQLLRYKKINQKNPTLLHNLQPPAKHLRDQTRVHAARGP